MRFSLVLLSLIVLLESERPTSAQTSEEADPTVESELVPRDNSEYYGICTTAKVTQRFEMYDPHSVEALRTLKEMGFTQVILDWPTLHADATAMGLDVVLANWWTDKTSQEEIDRGVELARQVERGRLTGLSVMDEPGRNSPETPFGFYIDLYEQLRPRLDAELPGTSVEISHWGPLASWDDRYYDYFAYLYEAADLMRIMPYPDLHEGPLRDVYVMMLRSREMMKIAERELPLLVILQAWVLPPKSKLPEIDELRVMAYQAMIGGAEVLSFFEYKEEVWAETPGFHDEFRELMGELTQFSDRMKDATITSSMNADGILRAVARWPCGRTQTILVNTNRTPAAGLASLAIIIGTPQQTRLTLGTQLVDYGRPCRPVRRRRLERRNCRRLRRSAFR